MPRPGGRPVRAVKAATRGRTSARIWSAIATPSRSRALTSRERASAAVRRTQRAVRVAVREIEHEADEHPDDQPVPVRDRQREHQQQTTEDAENRHERIERRAERTFGVRIRPPHDEHRGADDEKREAACRCSSCSAAPRSAEIPSGATQNMPIRICDFHGVRNFGWTAPKKLGGTMPSRAIARKHARRRQHQHEQHGRDAGHACRRDDELGPGQARPA